MLKFSHKTINSNIFLLKENKEWDEIFRNMSIIKMESSKSINYSTNMCPSDQVGPEGFLNSE
jgi:anaerobic ribonucleoside-triphosphate reductase